MAKPGTQAYGMIDRGMRRLRQNAQWLQALLGLDPRLSPLATRFSELAERILFEERMLRVRFGLDLIRRDGEEEERLEAPAAAPGEGRGAEVAAQLHNYLRTAQELARSLEEYFGFFRLAKVADFYRKVRHELYNYEREAAAILKLPGLSAAATRVEEPVEPPGRIESALSACPLYFILDESLCNGRDALRVGFDAVDGGVRMLQLRFKQMATRPLLDLARKLRQICAERDCLLIINDRIDVALLCGADGIHLGADDLTVREARRLGGELLIGATARQGKAALAAQADGADYIGAGSVFGSPTKPGLPVIGVVGLKQIAAAVDLPVVGIGGVTLENCAKVMGAGAAGFCAVSPFSARRSVKNLAADFRRRGKSAAAGGVEGSRG